MNTLMQLSTVPNQCNVYEGVYPNKVNYRTLAVYMKKNSDSVYTLNRYMCVCTYQLCFPSLWSFAA